MGANSTRPGRKPLLCCLAAAALALSSIAHAQAPAAPRFDIERFVVEGNTVLASEEVERIVAPHAGKNRDFGDVQRALEALQDAYLERGYTAVRVLIPEQDLVAGRVRLQVIEARIRSVRVEGNRHFDTPNVRASIPSLVPGEAPNTRAIGENVQLANENPAKQVSVALEAAEQDAGVNAVVRVVDDDPVRTTVFVDNTGNSQTGQLRAGIGFQHANIGNRDHVLNAQFITSPSKVDDVKILGVGYRLPVYAWNGAFDVFAGYSDVDSGVVANLFNVSGSGAVFGARYGQILPRLQGYEHKLVAAFDYRAFKQNVTLVGTTGTLVPDITVRPLSIAYSGRLSRLGQDLSFFASYSRNLPGGRDGDQAAFTAQRAGAPAGYSIWRFGAGYSHALPADFLLRAAFNAQSTGDLLVPGEQFGMGGADSVRGFFERELANDTGYRLSLEGYGPDFGARLGEDWRARALAFADLARGKDKAPERSAENGLGSVGIGLRLNRGKTVSIRADWARVVNAAGSRPDGKDRAHFSIAYSF